MSGKCARGKVIAQFLWCNGESFRKLCTFRHPRNSGSSPLPSSTRTLRSTTHALGLEFYATAYRYNLTFCCISCGRYEASANFRSDGIECEEQIKARIYPVRRAGCGWKGEPCGCSVTRILRYKSRETYSPDDNFAQLRPISASTF